MLTSLSLLAFPVTKTISGLGMLWDVTDLAGLAGLPFVGRQHFSRFLSLECKVRYLIR